MFEPSSLLLIAATAAVAGVLAGLLGIGGGVVIVPALIAVFTAADVDPAVKVQLAVGTSLATIMFTSVSSAWSHHRRGALHLALAAWFAPGVIAGAAVGVLVAAWMPGRSLQGFFGVFLVAIAARMVFGTLPDDPGPRHISRWMRVVCGVVIGGLSTMVGIGGGVLSVPIFVLLAGLTVHHAVGTAPALGLLLSVVGTVTWALRGQGVEGLPEGCIGYVAVLPAVAISVGTVSLAPVGAWLAHRLPRRQLSLAFAVLLVVVAGKLCVDAWRGEAPVIAPLAVDLQGFSGLEGDRRVFAPGDEVVVLVRPAAGPWQTTPDDLVVAVWLAAGALEAGEEPRRPWAARYPVCPAKRCGGTLDVAEGHLHARLALDRSGVPADGAFEVVVVAWPAARIEAEPWAERAASAAVVPHEAPPGVQVVTFPVLRGVPGSGDPLMEGVALRAEALRHGVDGRHAEALAAAEAALAVDRSHAHMAGEAVDLELAGAACTGLGQLGAAADHLRESGRLARLLGARDLEARSWIGLAEVLSVTDDHAGALEAMAAARPWLIPAEDADDGERLVWAGYTTALGRMQVRALTRNAATATREELDTALDEAAAQYQALGGVVGAAQVEVLRARRALLDGDGDGAQAALVRAAATLGGEAGPEAMAVVRLLQAEATLVGGDGERVLAGLEQLAAAPEVPRWRLEHLRGRAQTLGGRDLEAAATLLRATRDAPVRLTPGPGWPGLLPGPEPLFDEALLMALEHGGAAMAFEVSERSRVGGAVVVDVDRLAEALPEGSIALAYHVLVDEVVVFVVQPRGEPQVFRRHIAVDELQRVVDRQLSEIRGGGSGRTSPDLIPTLLPVTLQVRAGTELVLLPHGPVRDAPFAVVEKGRRHLVQDHPLRFAPSARDYLAAQEADGWTIRYAWPVDGEVEAAVRRRYDEHDGDRAEALRRAQVALMVGEEGQDAAVPRVWGAPQLWSEVR